MQRRNQTALTGMAAAATGLALALTIPAAAAATSHTTTVPVATSTQRDTALLLAGSDTQLVYGLIPTVTDTLEGAVAATPSQELLARRQSGVTRSLGTASITTDAGFSTLGDVVSAAVRTSIGAKPTRYVDMWTISNQHHRVLTLPQHTTYLSAGPNGVIYSAGNDLHLLTLAGKNTNFGAPFATTPQSVVTSKTGFVVTDAAGHVDYMTYADPGTFNPLNGGAASTATQCYSVNTTGAACKGSVRVPLDGSTNLTSGDCGDGAALSGTTLFWTDECSDDTQLHSSTPSGPAQTSGSFVEFRLVTAYDKAIAESPDRATIYSATSADTMNTLFLAPRSAETSGSFALSDSRIAYVSDRLDRKHPNLKTAMLSRTLRATRSGISVGALAHVSAPKGAVIPTVADLAGNTTVYLTLGTKFRYDVHIASADHTLTLHNAAFNTSDVQVSTGWVIVTDTPTPGVTVLNRRTGKSRQILTSKPPFSAALSGNHLAYTAPHGRIYRVNLVTGHTRTVFKPAKRHARGQKLTVVEQGPWVGWNDAMRNVHRTHVVRLSHRVYGISPHGVLMRGPQGFFEPTKIWLQPFNGQSHVLLTKRVYDEFPQLTSHALGWVDQNGALQLERFTG